MTLTLTCKINHTGLLQCAAGDQISFAEIVQDAPNYRLVAEPNKDAIEVSMNPWLMFNPSSTANIPAQYGKLLIELHHLFIALWSNGRQIPESGERYFMLTFALICFSNDQQRNWITKHSLLPACVYAILVQDRFVIKCNRTCNQVPSHVIKSNS